MSPQTATVVVDQDAAQLLQVLQAKAETLGVTLGSLLRPLVENETASATQRPLYETASPDELAQAYLDWANSHDPNIPPLPLAAMSRESIYEDR